MDRKVVSFTHERIRYSFFDYFTTGITHRSFNSRSSTKVLYSFQGRGSFDIERRQTTEYLPQEKYISLHAVSISQLRQDSNRLRVLVFIPTYNSRDYIIQRIRDAYKQCQQFDATWDYEIMVCLNGRGQQEVWNHLLNFKSENPDIAKFLTLVYISKEENKRMLQSKTTPENIAIEYARKNADVICALDDDVKLSERNLRSCIDGLIQHTRQKGFPVIIGGTTITPKPETTWEKIEHISDLKSNIVKGGNLVGWSSAVPMIPVDAGSEDYLFNALYREKEATAILPDEFCFYKRSSTYRKYLRQHYRFKWNDALAERYLNRQRPFSKIFKGNLKKIIPERKDDPKYVLSHMLVQTTKLAVLSFVKLEIAFRNLFNLPKDEIKWAGTEDPSSKKHRD